MVEIPSRSLHRRSIDKQTLQSLAGEHQDISDSFQEALEIRLRAGLPIMYERYTPLGDSLIMTDILFRTVTRFAQDRNLPTPTFQSYPTVDRANYHELSPVTWAGKLMNPEGIPVHFTDMHIIEAHTRVFSHLFGIPDLPTDYIPIPHTVDYGALSKFSPPKVIAAGQELEHRMIDTKSYLVVIYQSGSHPLKRLPTTAVEPLIQSIRSVRPNAHIVLLADDASNFSRLEKGNRFPDETISYPHMTELGAYGYAADAIIGTDTFWKWYMVGCQQLRRNQKETKNIFLYTLSIPTYWYLPGTYSVHSQLLDTPLSPNQITPNHTISGNLYIKMLYNGMNGGTQNIHETDIARLTNETQTILSV